MFASEQFADKPFSEVYIYNWLFFFMLHCYGLVQGLFLLRSCWYALFSHVLYYLAPLHILALLAPVAIECGATFTRSGMLPQLGTEKEGMHTPQPPRTRDTVAKELARWENGVCRQRKIISTIFLCAMSSSGQPLYCAYPLMSKFSQSKLSQMAANLQQPWRLNPTKIKVHMVVPWNGNGLRWNVNIILWLN